VFEGRHRKKVPKVNEKKNTEPRMKT